MDSFPTGLALIGLAVVLAIGFMTHERREHLPPLPAEALEEEAARQTVARAIEQFDDEPIECTAYPLDGNRENLIARLRCNGIAVVDWCDLSDAERRQLLKMGAPAERSCSDAR